MKAYAKIALIVLAILYGCFAHMPVPISININIYNNNEQEEVHEAINIIIDELDKEKIYTKEQMYNAINNAEKPLKIIFLDGVFNNKIKSNCIYKNDDHFKDICLYGYFNGSNEIEVVKTELLSQSALAHEIFHYMQRHVGNVMISGHNPEALWKKLVGFKDNSSIGTINEALKEEGL